MNKHTSIFFFIIFLFTSPLFSVETTTIDRMLIRKSNVTVQGSRLDRILNDEMRPPLIGSSVYRPVITVLPSGTNLSVNIVISGDRRYVRIGVSPMFSSIGRVETFMYAR